MSNNKTINLLTLIFTLTFFLNYDLFAIQNNEAMDSIEKNNYELKLTELEAQTLINNSKRIELENKINKLESNDILQKEKLIKELNTLKEQEQNNLQNKINKINLLRNHIKSYPVYGFLADTLFVVYHNLGSFTAEDRANAINNRIDIIKKEFNTYTDSLLIQNNELNIDIVYKDKTIITITDNDAIWNNTSKDTLATIYKNKIYKSILKYKSETSYLQISKEIGLVLIVLICFWYAVKYTKKILKKIEIIIKEQQGKLITGLKIKDYTLFDAQKLVKVLVFFNDNLFKVIFLLLSYLALTLVFGIFPWTKNFANTLFGFIITPIQNIFTSIWEYLPKLFTILVIIFVFKYLMKAIAFLKNEIKNGNLKLIGFYSDWANPTYQIVRVLLYSFMFIVIFPYLPGSDSPIFQGVSVFLGVLFTFGSSGSLSNLIAGLVITYMRSYKIGDRVKISDITGDIIEKNLLVTRIRTIKNEIISIPNSNILNSHTINYSSDASTNGLILYTTVTIGYDVPWKNMHNALLMAADRNEMLNKEPKPFVLQTGLEDFNVSYQINAFTSEPNKQAIIYSILNQNIQDCCNECGIEILSPHYRAIRDGNMVTIPENYFNSDYQSPSFNIKINNNDKSI